MTQDVTHVGDTDQDKVSKQQSNQLLGKENGFFVEKRAGSESGSSSPPPSNAEEQLEYNFSKLTSPKPGIRLHKRSKNFKYDRTMHLWDNPFFKKKKAIQPTELIKDKMRYHHTSFDSCSCKQYITVRKRIIAWGGLDQSDIAKDLREIISKTYMDVLKVPPEQHEIEYYTSLYIDSLRFGAKTGQYDYSLDHIAADIADDVMRYLPKTEKEDGLDNIIPIKKSWTKRALSHLARCFGD